MFRIRTASTQRYAFGGAAGSSAGGGAFMGGSGNASAGTAGGGRGSSNIRFNPVFDDWMIHESYR
jgi:hypothetical protein